jgi:hypothetical protein
MVIKLLYKWFNTFITLMIMYNIWVHHFLSDVQLHYYYYYYYYFVLKCRGRNIMWCFPLAVSFVAQIMVEESIFRGVSLKPLTSSAPPTGKLHWSVGIVPSALERTLPDSELSLIPIFSTCFRKKKEFNIKNSYLYKFSSRMPTVTAVARYTTCSHPSPLLRDTTTEHRQYWRMVW